MAKSKMRGRVAPEVHEHEVEVQEREESGERDVDAAPPPDGSAMPAGSANKVMLWLIVPLLLVILWEAVIAPLVGQ